MTSLEDQICSQLNDIPTDNVEKSYWRRRLPPAFRFFLEMLARELLVSTPSNTFAHSAQFFEELLLQRDIELSLLPYEPYLEKILQRNGLQARHKPDRKADIDSRCGRCGGLVCEMQAQGDKPTQAAGFRESAPAYTPAPSYAPEDVNAPPAYNSNLFPSKTTKNPDFAVFGEPDILSKPPPSQPPSNNQGCCKKCCHCGAKVPGPAPQYAPPPPPDPQPQSRPPSIKSGSTYRQFDDLASTSSAKGPDFAFFGEAEQLSKPTAGKCSTCGHALTPDQGGVQNMYMAGEGPKPKVEEEYPVYTIIPCTYEKDAWGRLMSDRGRRNKDELPYAELLNSRSLSILMDY